MKMTNIRVKGEITLLISSKEQGSSFSIYFDALWLLIRNNLIQIKMIYPQQQNQQFIHLMSKLSNIQSQNHQALISHRNEPHTTPIAHSQHPNPLPAGGGQKEWIATYIDGQYFLTDPQSMNKLKNIEAQIEQQRNRLAKLQHDNTSNNNSFLSYQDQAQERQSNNSFCDTQFNPSRHFNKQERVKVQLEKEEEMYREKLKNMEREKMELKKNMKQIDQPIKKEEQNKPSPSHKRSSQKNQPIIEQQNKSKKLTQQEIKDKSYHKSRIEKSIKDNIVLNQEIIQTSPQKSVKVENGQQENASAAKSVKVVQGQSVLKIEGSARKQVAASSKKEPIGSTKKDPSAKQESHVSKSIKIVVMQPNGHQIEIDKQSTTKQEPQKSVKAEISPEKSVKAETKSINLQQKSVKGQQKSIKAAPSVKNDEKSIKASQKSMKIQQKPKSIVQQEIHQIEKSVKIQNQKSIKNSNFDKKSQKPLQILQQSPNKSQKSHQQQALQVQQPKHSQRKSVKKSQKLSNYEKAPSQKPQSVKISQRPTPSVKVAQIIHENRSQKQQKISEKAPSMHSQKLQGVINESPTKSVKRSSVKASSKNKIITNQLQQIPKSIKSKLNEPIIVNHQELQKKSIKSAARSNLLNQPEEEVKSRRSNLIEEIKSKKSQQIDQQIKSKKFYLNSAKVEDIDTKSKKSQKIQIIPSSHQLQVKSIKHEEDIVSKKSSFKNREQAPSVKEEFAAREQIQEIKSKKSAKIQNSSEVLSKKSNKEEVLSKKSSKQSPQKSIINKQETIIKDEQPSIKSKAPSEKQSFTKKQTVSAPIQIKQTLKQVNLVDQSIQYSRVSEQPPLKFQQESPSEKNTSFIIQKNDVSMNQSSQLKLQMLQNELKPQVKDAIPAEYNMKKKKEQLNQNQSEKKSKSFVIHSRQGSVKDRSQKQYEKLNNSKASSPSRKSKDNSAFNESSVMNQSVTKEEISKLHQQILLLQEKLKKVQDRQELLQKFEGTISKIHQNQQPIRKSEHPQEESRVKPETPIIQNLAELSIAIKAQPRLQIQSSILQVNTTDDIKKKQEKEVEHSEKTKLKDEIGRLKRIIRDMQIEKIKSIDHEAQGESPTLRPRNFDGKESREIDRQSRIQKESINSFQGISGQRRFGSNNKRLLEDAGKIMHNTSYLDKPIETPKRRSVNKMKLMGSSEDEVVIDPIQLPNNSTNKKNKFYSEVRKNQLVNKLGDKERDFHNFIESSRVIAEENSNNKADSIEPVVTPFKNFSRITVGQDSGGSKINYSRMVQQMKKNNPQQQEVLPEIHMRDIKMPNLPPLPNSNMTQEELLALAKATYLVFGINVDEEDKQLCVKKYKNCVIFTLNNQNHQCILWHFSGKFYMGGWRTGEPGEGQKDGQGLQYIPDKHVYKGQFLNGKKNGTGILKLSNGNIYDGQWIDGIKNGRGVYLDSATKVIYSGEWRDGKKQGQGFLKLSQKEYYYGTFIKSIKQGFGVQIFVNGDKYKGQYKNGKFHGKGKYVWANGSCYQGQFIQGVRHGQGSWKSAKINGDIYIGTYDNDKKNGYGRYVWANGCMYQGGFSQDVKHGKGRLTYQDGKEIKGVWEQGNLMSTQTEKPIEHEDQPLRRSVKVTSFGYPSSSKRI